MNSVERRLFREQVIREYKDHLKQEKKPAPFASFRKKLRKFAPVNIVIGVIACILLIITKGWGQFFGLILSGIIWITLISTALSIIKPND